LPPARARRWGPASMTSHRVAISARSSPQKDALAGIVERPADRVSVILGTRLSGAVPGEVSRYAEPILADGPHLGGVDVGCTGCTNETRFLWHVDIRCQQKSLFRNFESAGFRACPACARGGVHGGSVNNESVALAKPQQIQSDISNRGSSASRPSRMGPNRFPQVAAENLLHYRLQLQAAFYRARMVTPGLVRRSMGA